MISIICKERNYCTKKFALLINNINS